MVLLFCEKKSLYLIPGIFYKLTPGPLSSFYMYFWRACTLLLYYFPNGVCPWCNMWSRMCRIFCKNQWLLYNVLCLVTLSCPTLCDPMDCSLPGPSVHGGSPGKNTGVGCHALPSGDLLNPVIEPRSPTLQADSLLSRPPVPEGLQRLPLFLPLLPELSLLALSSHQKPVQRKDPPPPLFFF